MNQQNAPDHRPYRLFVRPISIDIAGLTARATAGTFMAFGHGQGKLFGDVSEFAVRVETMGFPAPEFFAWAAAVSEFVGGLAMALGLGTRISALLVAATMIVAAFIRHAADPFGKKEPALMYLVVCIVIFLIGPGRFSLDHLLFGRRS